MSQVGWSSIKDYYTYTWANVPENYTEGAPVDCCVLFHGETLAILFVKIPLK